MKPVILTCAHLVHQEMINMIDLCLDKSHRFQRVNAGILEVVNELLNERMDKTREVLENYIDIQASSGLTWDDKYHEELQNLMKEISSVDLGKVPNQLILNRGNSDPLLALTNGAKLIPNANNDLTTEQIKACESVRKLLDMYFLIVRKQVQDHVPKTLQHSLIFHAVTNMNYKLVSQC